MSERLYDIAIIGGGVNGCGIARDAAGRGLSVLLAEKDDLASGTSSASTKLIHGGLRYLEYYEFKLVRESLVEREVLLAMAPHVIRPLRFVLPHHRALRPAWFIRLGLFLYDHLGGRRVLPGSRYVDLAGDDAGVPLKPEFKRGFEYSDCWVDDARLVVLNALDAARRGAAVRTRTEVLSATPQGDVWRIELADGLTGETETVAARLLVNAAGPWISQVISERLEVEAKSRTRLVKGSHIVVPKLFEHGRAYIFQNADKRIVFAIPYEGDFTLIGTTDVDFEGDPGSAAAETDEVAYLCAAASEYFSTAIEPSQVVWAYSGVRPLFDDGGTSAQDITRDYTLDLVGGDGAPVVLNIFGGKLTTYRHLAEEVLDKLRPWIPETGPPWTAAAALPGGDFPADGFEALLEELRSDFPDLDADLMKRLARAYGTTVHDILAGATEADDLGVHFGAGLYEREVEHLIRNEWARTTEDILWRRSKLGLRLSDEEVGGLADWLKENYTTVIDSAA